MTIAIINYYYYFDNWYHYKKKKIDKNSNHQNKTLRILYNFRIRCHRKDVEIENWNYEKNY